MGSLTPGATYIYESSDNGETVYAREFGKLEKKLIGNMYDPNSIIAQLHDLQLWVKIRKEAETNPALQKALEHAILIYKVSTGNE